MRDQMKANPAETLKAIAAMGYRYVEYGLRPSFDAALETASLKQKSAYLPTYLVTGNRQAWAQSGDPLLPDSYTLDDEQRRIAEETIAEVDASGLWPGKVVTEVAPAGPFWEAEPEHQDYLEHYPNGYTCHFVRPQWVLPSRERAAAG